MQVFLQIFSVNFSTLFFFTPRICCKESCYIVLPFNDCLTTKLHIFMNQFVIKEQKQIKDFIQTTLVIKSKKAAVSF